MYNQPNTGDKYYGILNTLSGKAQDKFKAFFNFVFSDPELSDIYELLLVCDDPSPIIDELWFYFITGMNPRESPTFKEFVVKYITLSVTSIFILSNDSIIKHPRLVLPTLGGPLITII